VCRVRVRLNPSITEGAIKELGSAQKSIRLRSQINGSSDAESGQDVMLGEMDGLEGGQAQLHKQRAGSAAAMSAGAQASALPLLHPETEATPSAAADAAAADVAATAGVEDPAPAADSQLEQLCAMVKLLVEPALPMEHHVAKSLGTIFLLAEHKAQHHTAMPSSKSQTAATIVDVRTVLTPQSSTESLPGRFNRLSLDATMHVRSHQEKKLQQQHEQECLLHGWLTDLGYLVDELAARGFGVRVDLRM
ncbi:hypothetical protein DUNSADRAFT_18495, partial [Dunaliella salina]